MSERKRKKLGLARRTVAPLSWGLMMLVNGAGTWTEVKDQLPGRGTPREPAESWRKECPR
jgi:hypothetical protein